MSLIHDALRKAAEESARREGRPLPSRRVDLAPLPAPRRRRLWLPVAGVVAALAVFALFWRQAPPPPAARVEAPDAPSAAPAPVAPPAAPAVAEVAPAPPREVAPEEASSAPPVEAPRVEMPAAPSPAPPSAPPIPAATTPIATTPPAPTPTPSAPPAAPETPPPATTGTPPPRLIAPPAQVGQVADDAFVLRAEVDGRTLELDFIVWGAEPFAQINGRQVSVGQQVDGYLVTAITREQVTLEKPNRRLFLRIR